jgi:hypothetical protein
MAGPLSPAELRTFKADGYVIKRRHLSPELCAAARDWVWAHSEDLGTSRGPAGLPMRRDDPASWVGPFTPADAVPTKGAEGGLRFPRGHLAGDRWIVQDPFGASELFCDLLPRRCMPIAEQLLGAGTLVQPVPGARFNHENWSWERGGGLHGCGMYGALPMVEGDGEGSTARRRPHAEHTVHVDAMACNLGCVGYIDDVPRDGGGFAIYPRSHRRLHHAFEHAYSVVAKDEYYATVAAITQHERPMAFEGRA